MKKVLFTITVLASLYSCGKDENKSNIDLSGKWLRVGFNDTGDKIDLWKFDNGSFIKNTTTIGTYTLESDLIVIKTGSYSFRYEVSVNNDLLLLKGNPNDFVFGSDLPSEYKFKRYYQK